MDKLVEICHAKREHVAARKAILSEAELRAKLADIEGPRGFHHALITTADGPPALICEIKKASPSKGLIREDFNPAQHARDYQLGGARCLSVLTDTPYFQGSDEDLIAARGAVALPVLRKDFMVDPYQIVESRYLGADAILIIMAALSDDQARTLEEVAHKLNMDALIEVHDEAEMQRALTHLSSKLIGINNRNLKTLKIDLQTSINLRSQLPEGYTVVCESGIQTRDDIARMRSANMHCFLVGHSLMLQRNIELATKELL